MLLAEFGRGGFLTWWQRPKLWMGGGRFSGDDEISVSTFRFLPQMFGEGFCSLWVKSPHSNGSCAQAAAGIAVPDQCRHLLICSAMYPRWAPAASFAWFCILIVLLYLFLQLLRHHGGTALFKCMVEQLCKRAKFWNTPQKRPKYDQDGGGGHLMVQLKPSSAPVSSTVLHCCQKFWPEIDSELEFLPKLLARSRTARRILIFLPWNSKKRCSFHTKETPKDNGSG